MDNSFARMPNALEVNEAADYVPATPSVVGGGGGVDNSLPGAAKRATKIQLPGVRPTNTRSLFIFSEDNFIRKYAQIIIEWIYPFFWRFKVD